MDPEALSSLPAGFLPGDLVTLKPRTGERGYHDPVQDERFKLWSDSSGRHVEVRVGSQALIVGVLAVGPVQAPSDLRGLVFEVLVDCPELGPVVASTFPDRMVPIEAAQ